MCTEKKIWMVIQQTTNGVFTEKSCFHFLFYRLLQLLGFKF